MGMTTWKPLFQLGRKAALGSCAMHLLTATHTSTGKSIGVISSINK